MTVYRLQGKIQNEHAVLQELYGIFIVFIEVHNTHKTDGPASFLKTSGVLGRRRQREGARERQGQRTGSEARKLSALFAMMDNRSFIYYFARYLITTFLNSTCYTSYLTFRARNRFSRRMAVRVLRQQCFTVSWLAFGAFVWLWPLYLFIHSRLTHHLPNNYEQSIHNRGYNGNNDDLGWGSYFGGNGNDDDDIRWRNYRDNNCSWLFGCEYQSHEQAKAPGWWLFGSDKSSEVSPSLRAALAMVYLGSSVMFAGILYFGYHTAVMVRADQFQNLDPLLPVLVVFALFSALTMVLVGCIGGMVDTSGKEFMKHGWFGQMGILLFVTAFFWIIFSMIFIFVIRTGFFRMCFFPLDSIDNYQLQDMSPKGGPSSPAKTEAAFAPRTRSRNNFDRPQSPASSPRGRRDNDFEGVYRSRTAALPRTRTDYQYEGASPARTTAVTRTRTDSQLGSRRTPNSPPLKSLNQRRWEDASTYPRYANSYSTSDDDSV